MKKNCCAKTFTLAITAALALVGCAKSPVGLTKIPGQPMGQDTKSELASADPVSTSDGLKTSDTDANGGIAQADPANYSTWIPDPAALAAFTVHFDYDSSSIKASEESKLTSVAEHMKGAAPVALRIEGHCDERGTEEYNRSLGDRRANALREKLASMGVNAQKILTQSFGEDKPVDSGHNEAAWSKNRRGEFILLTPPTPGQLTKLEK